MGNEEAGVLHNSSDGGVAGKHPAASPFEPLVAPSTASQSNKARLRLIPVACWRVDDVRFAFDSSFVTPAITQELQLLISVRAAHKVKDLRGKVQYPPLSVFGHADPVGNDDYNKGLSGRRATVIYALLISGAEPAKAVSLWEQIASTEKWGASQFQTMQTATGLPTGTSHHELTKAYIKKLCPPELQLSPQDFLAQGADGEGKGDYQGCSEFNPLLIFSQEKQDKFDQGLKAQDPATLEQRNNANSPNRRVVVLLFRVGSKVNPTKWPCPRAGEGTAGCVHRFWSDGESRRSARLPNQDREFSNTRDTFACRFYQRLTTSSPCERKVTNFRIRLFDKLGVAIPNAPYLANEGVPLRGTADESGTVVLSNVTVPSKCTISWRRPKKPESDAAKTDDFEFSMSVFIDIDDDEQDQKKESARRQLHNLGFAMGDSLIENIRFFQREFGALETGRLEDIEEVLKKRHAALDPPSRYKGLEGATLPAAPQEPAGPPPPVLTPDPDPLPEGDE